MAFVTATFCSSVKKAKTFASSFFANSTYMFFNGRIEHELHHFPFILKLAQVFADLFHKFLRGRLLSHDHFLLKLQDIQRNSFIQCIDCGLDLLHTSFNHAVNSILNIY